MCIFDDDVYVRLNYEAFYWKFKPVKFEFNLPCECIIFNKNNPP